MPVVTNISTYCFAELSELKDLREELQASCKSWNLKGTILLSTEGINLFVAGAEEMIDRLLTRLRTIPGLENLTPKVSTSDHQPFNRMLVRIKKEIISFGVDGVRPGTYTSPKLSPKELKRWLDEGMAAYIGGSVPRGDTFAFGTADRNAYPTWWLHRHDWHGALEDDRAAGFWTPLADLIDDRVAPGRGGDVNRVYVQYWALMHFLLHHARGALRPGLHALLREGGGSAAFERAVGPLGEIEPAVHAHLMAQADEARRRA